MRHGAALTMRAIANHAADPMTPTRLRLNVLAWLLLAVLPGSALALVSCRRDLALDGAVRSTVSACPTPFHWRSL